VAAALLGSGAVAVAATPSPSPAGERTAGSTPTPTADGAERQADEAARRAAEDEAERRAARVKAKAERQAAKVKAKAERQAARGAGTAPRGAPPTGPAFVCDPALSHGQNVSAYARSLPKGPGRGRLVSQAARSDCGTTAADD